MSTPKGKGAKGDQMDEATLAAEAKEAAAKARQAAANDAEREERHREYEEKNKTAGINAPEGFYYDEETGWWFKGTTQDLHICGPLRVVGRTRDQNGDNHGILLEWNDHDGLAHSWAMPREMLAGTSPEIVSVLQKGGLPSCPTTKPGMSLLFSLLNKYVVERVVLCVDRCGWHDNDYVFPDGSTVGQKDIVLQVARPVVAALYKPSGTLDDWKKEIASVAVGNDLMLTSMCCSFAGPLLKIMAVSRFGVHFHGPSSFGKTKSLLASTASIFRSGDEAKLLKWRGTDNGLEAEAARHNDGPLPIDETGQAEPRALDASIMMLGNGSGKSRADSRGEARQPKLFENVVISSGEQTIEGALAKGGIRSRAGHDVRLVNINVDVGFEHKVWQQLHGRSAGDALTNEVHEASKRLFGTAGREFVGKIVADVSALGREELRLRLKRQCDAFIAAANLTTEADGQVRRVAGHFATAAAAGELATEYGITGWPKGEAARGVLATYQRWLEARGGAGAGEDLRGMEAVKAFIAEHGGSRFEIMLGDGDENPKTDAEAVNDSLIDAAVADPDRVVYRRAGWKRRKGDGWEYLITRKAWKDEICASLEPAAVARAVHVAGYLDRGDGKNWGKLVRVPGHGRPRLYAIDGHILGGDTDPDPKPKQAATAPGPTGPTCENPVGPEKEYANQDCHDRSDRSDRKEEGSEIATTAMSPPEKNHIYTDFGRTGRTGRDNVDNEQENPVRPKNARSDRSDRGGPDADALVAQIAAGLAGRTDLAGDAILHAAEDGLHAAGISDTASGEGRDLAVAIKRRVEERRAAADTPNAAASNPCPDGHPAATECPPPWLEPQGAAPAIAAANPTKENGSGPTGQPAGGPATGSAKPEDVAAAPPTGSDCRHREKTARRGAEVA